VADEEQKEEHDHLGILIMDEEEREEQAQEQPDRLKVMAYDAGQEQGKEE
jgi:hypothetical protein